MAIEFDGKGNITSTTEDGVIALKLYSSEKALEEKDKEIERLNRKLENLEKLNNSNYQSFIEVNNIINKINKILEADTHCENIYYAIGVLLNKRYFDIKMVDNEELLNILGSDKE